MKTKNKWINSVLRFVLFQVVLLFVLTIVILSIGQYSRETQADSIGSSIRNSYLIGDNRSVVKALNESLHTGYIFIEVFSSNNTKILQVGNDESRNNFFINKYVLEIYSNPLDETALSGKIYFFYNVRSFILNSFLIWLFFLVFSSPILILEKKKLEKIYAEELRIHELRTLTSLAEQVSHDIRSPLAVLQGIAEDLSGFPEAEAIVLKRAISRIEGIANDLLNIQKRDHPDRESNDNSNINLESLNTQLEIIVSEKKIQYKSKPNIEIRYESLKKSLMINMNQIDFYRAISNLINNSIEAIESSGLILITLSEANGQAIIRIQDSGKGIPSHVIARIGERKFSYDKNTKDAGTGLGIFFVKSVIQSLNGTFLIESELKKGTVITISLPILLSKYDCVLIDDDELVRMIWESAATKAGIKFLAVSSVEDFSKFKDGINKSITKIYIDSELGKDKLKGEEFAKILHLEKFANLYIATGHPPERFKDMSWLKYSSKKCPF